LLARIPAEVSKQYSTEFAKRVFSCTSVQLDVLLERFVLAKHFWISSSGQQQPQCPSAPPGQRGDSTAAAVPQCPKLWDWGQDSSPSKTPSLKVPQAFFEDDLEVCSSMGGYFLPESISGLTKQRLLSYEPEEDARFLTQLLKAQGYGADSTHSIRQDANGGAYAEVQTPQPRPKRARTEETPTAVPPAGTAGSDHDDDDNAVQIVADDAAVTDTEAELAAEAHKAKMLSQLVKAANHANYTSFMLAPHTADKKIVVLPDEITRDDVRIIMWNIMDIYGATQTEKSLITCSTVNMFSMINERKNLSQQLEATTDVAVVRGAL
jgi:hypothetical protein